MRGCARTTRDGCEYKREKADARGGGGHGPQDQWWLTTRIGRVGSKVVHETEAWS